ncbi:hypothetical protein DYB34_007026, partial [Aphanomyces astaci]
ADKNQHAFSVQMWTWVADYWCINVPLKSVEELDAETWLVLCPRFGGTYATWTVLRFSRWHVAVLSWLSFFMLGSIYSFQILAPPLEQYFAPYTGLSGFYGSTLVLGVVAAIVGPFVERRGPRTGMLLGSVLVDVMLSCYRYSALVGGGYGVVLLTAMSTLQKWFPDLRGFVSGLAIVSLGVGTGLWTKLSATLMHRSTNILDSVSNVDDEIGLTRVFLVQAITALLLFVVATMVMRTPPANYTVGGHDIHCVPVHTSSGQRMQHQHLQDEYFKVGMTLVNYSDHIANTDSNTDNVYFEHVRALSLVQCIASSDFMWLYVAFAANVAPIVLVVPSLFDIATTVLEASSEDASTFVRYLFLATSIGRFSGPAASDVLIRVCYANPAFGRKLMFGLLLTIQAVATGLLVVATHGNDSGSGFRWPAYVLGFALGGGFAIMPALVTDMFGVFNTGTMYGLLLTSWSMGATGWGLVAATDVVSNESVASQLWALLVVAIVGVVVLPLVRTNTMDRFYRGYQLTMCDTVVVQVPSRQMRLDKKQRGWNNSTVDDSTASHHRWDFDEIDRLSSSSCNSSVSPILASDGDYGKV